MDNPRSRAVIPTSMRLALILLAAGLVLGFIVRGNRSLAGDEAILDAIQSVSFAGLEPIIHVVDFIGSTAGGIIAVICLVIIGHVTRHERFSQQVVIVAGLRLVGEVLKPIFDSPRPPLDHLQDADRALTTYGYPSGHAFTYTCIGGMLLVLAFTLRVAVRWRWCLMIMACLLVLAGAFTRPWLGLHWPYDMVGGILFGSAAVLIALSILPIEVNPEAADTSRTSVA